MRRGTLLAVTDPVDEVPPIDGPGPWAEHGRCAQLDLVTAVFVTDRPDPDEGDGTLGLTARGRPRRCLAVHDAETSSRHGLPGVWRRGEMSGHFEVNAG